jgi:lysophospholipase L1-like esterase
LPLQLAAFPTNFHAPVIASRGYLTNMVASRFKLIWLILAAASPSLAEQQPLSWKYSFPGTPFRNGFTAVTADAAYDKNVGYGFEPGSHFQTGKPFYFSIRLAEGNYNVHLTLGDPKADSVTTVKAELRRLMIENLHTDPGQFVTRTITVNIRQPGISTGGHVSLKGTRESVTEAWGWDDKLTLEFNGRNPSVRDIEITPAQVPTLFILGDSTSCDQSEEPWNSWGQMITQFFKPGVAVANHGESGESLASAVRAHRLEKILDSLKPGDYVFVQFGHNDQKDKTPGSGPFTTYKANLKTFVDQVRAKGGQPVLVTPVSRKTIGSLGEFPAAVRQLAQDEKVPLIDLNKMSETLYQAIGSANLDKAFVDGTHHNAYGSYEIAKCVIAGIQQANLDLAAFVADDFSPFDPAHPDSVADFHLPPSPNFSTTKPLAS